MIRACIFDLDGVIVDTAKYHFLAWQEMAHSLGVEFTEAHNENLKGVGRMESLAYILGLEDIVLSQQEMIDLAISKNEKYVSLISNLNDSDILPGVLSFLKELKKHDIKIALGSSSKNARPVLTNLMIKDFFDVIVDGTNITKSKPDPEVFLLGANELSIPPSEIVVFEDAKAGVEAAKNGGFLCIGIGDPLELNGADYVMQSFDGFTLDSLTKTFNNLL